MIQTFWTQIVPIILLIWSLVGLFLSLWIVVPAPNEWLLRLGVGAPEVSPQLVLMNALVALFALLDLRAIGLSRMAALAGFLALGLSVLPLVQLPTAVKTLNEQMLQTLGHDFLQVVPPDIQATFRPKPFEIADAFLKIPEKPVRTERGIPFASPDGVPLALNLYRPLSVGHYPTIVMVHGGAWRGGSPDYDEQFNRYFAARGYTVVAITYRRSPQYRFPAHLEDVKTALKHILANAATYEVDPARIVIMGRSAGAHLAMLATYAVNGFPVRGLVNYYGPVDLLSGYYDIPQPDPTDVRSLLRDFLGGPPDTLKEAYQAASPIYQVRPNLPPSLMIYASNDHLVPARFGRKLRDRLIEQGNRPTYLEIPWAEHAFDSLFNGVSNQVALYYTERFIAWALYRG